MKKILAYILIVFINYVFISFLVFSFSYLSLVNNKTYDLFWVKSIQKKLYFRGLRNLWQYNDDCVTFNENLLYTPKSGECNFKNPEFDTKLTFDEEKRINLNKIKFSENANAIGILGDSITMGWGVNDNETYSSELERLTQKKVLNFGVASYGTIREIKKLKLSKYYNQIDTIIIQYHFNDIFENKELDYKKKYLIEEYNSIFKSSDLIQNKFIFLLRNFKTSLRLFFADIIDKINKKDNLRTIDFKYHVPVLEKVILEHLGGQNKRIIVIFIEESFMSVKNFPKNNKNIEYFTFTLDKSNFFVVDEHLNSKGHAKVANKLYEYFER